MTMVKVCGLRDLHTLQATMQTKVDIIGFVFARSRRQVTPDQAASMIEKVRQQHDGNQVRFAGVFVNPSKEQLNHVLDTVPLHIVQLHGQEMPDLCQWLRTNKKVQVFKVFPLSDLSNLELMTDRLDPYANAIDALMLDTYDPQYGGGSGKTFRWEAIPTFQQWTSQTGIPLMVAGGLNASNVTTLLQDYHPDGVDVSSGVETDGIKDIKKIQTFVGRVKTYDQLSG